MQQRVNNLWLSDQLIAAVASDSASANPSTVDIISCDAPSRVTLRSTTQSHHRMWQHLATALLLVGSAAFSYLAWSQSEFRPSAAPTLTSPLMESSKDGSLTTPPEDVTRTQMRVHELRVKNRHLQQRIAELEADRGTDKALSK
ncbi:hypothetical protein [Congregibacter sp.]|uniref:hypothetical protein n=1 Tax=Congregibacter sp. TaxID=2744308 RepID=UPI003F6BC27F